MTDARRPVNDRYDGQVMVEGIVKLPVVPKESYEAFEELEYHKVVAGSNERKTGGKDYCFT